MLAGSESRYVPSANAKCAARKCGAGYDHNRFERFKDRCRGANQLPVYPKWEVTSVILSLPPGGKTDWMTHPVPGYLYVLQGELTVEFEDGRRLVFTAGQAFMQARTKWHRGINTGTGQMRFLAVFFGEKGTPVLLNPPRDSEAHKPSN